MSEETGKIIPSVIAAAVAAAGPMGNNPGAWKGKVNNAIPAIAAMMHETTRQWKIAEEVLGASVFHATYVSHEIEDSSTRVVVLIDTGKATKNYPTGIEPIRSHRTDNAQGRHMLERLNRLKPGQEIMVWKTMESMGEGVDANKVRVLVHFEPLPVKRTDSPGRGAAVTAAPTGEGRPVDTPVHAAGESGAPTSDDPGSRRFNELPGKVKAAVVKRLRAEGISFPDPGPDDIDRFIIIINETEREQG
jgi:hypothetical protein